MIIKLPVYVEVDLKGSPELVQAFVKSARVGLLQLIEKSAPHKTLVHTFRGMDYKVKLLSDKSVEKKLTTWAPPGA